MLQQTQVAAVIPYFQRFLARFPTVRALAAADEQDVLLAWEGLGYYRRARHLHQAARVIVAEHGGQLPDDPGFWQRLPGVGRYILGAVLSQAFDRRLPIIEANSTRVLSRLYARMHDPRSANGQKWLWGLAAELVPAKRAGDFNQALMELGALVCKIDKPRCDECPWAGHCAARKLGKVDVIPKPPERSPVTKVQNVAVVVRKRGRVLLVRRPSHVRWASMWEFPCGDILRREEPVDAAARVLREATNVIADIGDELLSIRHGVTRYRIHLIGVEARYRRGNFLSAFYVEGRWLKPDQLSALPISSAQRKLALRLEVAGEFGR